MKTTIEFPCEDSSMLIGFMSIFMLVLPPRPRSLSIIVWWSSNPRTAAKKVPRLCPSFLVYHVSCQTMVPVPPYPPSKIHPGSLPSSAFLPYPLSSFLLPPLRPFLCSRPSTSSSVWSPVVRPSELQPSGWLPTQCPSPSVLSSVP